MPNWDAIRQEWETSDITFKDLANKHGVKEGTLKSRRSRERWQRSQKDATVTKKMQQKLQPREPVILNDDLTDKQKLFCIYYIKSFNQTMAAIKAGYAQDSAHVEGHRLLRNAKVAEEIRRLKGEMQQGVFIDAMDVLNKYIQIAFADLTEFVKFTPIESFREIENYDDDGKIKSTEKVPYTYTEIRLQNSDEVDGTILTELTRDQMGAVKVKLADKMKALEMLTKYFDLLPDATKRRLEEERLKLELAQMTGDSENDAHEQGSSYEDALNAQVEDVFADETT